MHTIIKPPHTGEPTLDVDNDIVPSRSFFAYLVGRPGSGKSTLLRSMLMDPARYLGKFDRVLLISPNAAELQLPLDQADVTETWSLDWVFERLESVYAAVHSKLARLKREAAAKDAEAAADPSRQRPFKRHKVRASRVRSNVLFVCDDVISGIKTSEADPRLTRLLFNRRHLLTIGDRAMLSVSVLIASQKYTMLPARIRSTVTWLVAFAQPGNDLARIADELVVGMSKQEFLAMAAEVYRVPHAAIQIRVDLGGAPTPIMPPPSAASAPAPAQAPGPPGPPPPHLPAPAQQPRRRRRRAAASEAASQS